LGFLLTGTSLIFYQFKMSENYPQRLFAAYLLLLAEIGDYGQLEVVEVLFFVVITFFITVILLNILIALMTDAYEKILTSIATNDSKERVGMILESITILSVFSFFCNINLAQEDQAEIQLPVGNKDEAQKHRGYLFNVTDETNTGQGSGAGGEWEGRVNSLKNHISTTIRKHLEPLGGQNAAFKAQQEEIKRLNQKMSFLQQDMKTILAYFMAKDTKASDVRLDKIPMFSNLTNMVAHMAENIDEGYQSGDINKKAEYPEDAEDEIIQHD